GNIMSQLGKAEGAKYWTTVGNLVAGASAFLGEVGKMGGAILEKTDWGVSASRMAERLSFGAFGNAADLLSGAGKLLGVVGGVLAGLLQMWEGYESLNDGDVVFGWGSIFLGFSLGMLSIILSFTTLISGGLALVIFGKHALGGEKFPNLHAQTLAYDALLKEE
ncbi:MAG: hypothetical protein P8014_15690, partial [Acidihalobacter sp.]|uniref:hypothetical protein n=1 Tax=Acidihalobacter sp. TaxID=1872108 RepID=UPI00307D9B79